jgi:fibronectin-binding autotransporter adhesin
MSAPHAIQSLPRLRRAALLACAGSLLSAAPSQAVLYWDSDASPVNNNSVTGAGLGGAGTWGSAGNWFNGSADTTWTAGSDAVFNGTSGVVTLGSAQSAASVSFKSDGYSLTGSTLTMGPTPANYNVDAGVTATISSTIAGSATMTKIGAGTLVLSNTANVNTATATPSLEGGWRIDGGTLWTRTAAPRSIRTAAPTSATQ